MTAIRWRSVLFAPANQPALVAKLSRSAPDVVVLDLEDAVPAPNKGEARAAAVDAIVTLGAPDGAPLVAVRQPRDGGMVEYRLVDGEET